MAHADEAPMTAPFEIVIPAHVAPRATTANRLVRSCQTPSRASVRPVGSDLRSRAAPVATSRQT
jgi:hypothetical protein